MNLNATKMRGKTFWHSLKELDLCHAASEYCCSHMPPPDRDWSRHVASQLHILLLFNDPKASLQSSGKEITQYSNYLECRAWVHSYHVIMCKLEWIYRNWNNRNCHREPLHFTNRLRCSLVSVQFHRHWWKPQSFHHDVLISSRIWGVSGFAPPEDSALHSPGTWKLIWSVCLSEHSPQLWQGFMATEELTRGSFPCPDCWWTTRKEIAHTSVKTRLSPRFSQNDDGQFPSSSFLCCTDGSTMTFWSSIARIDDTLESHQSKITCYLV